MGLFSFLLRRAPRNATPPPEMTIARAPFVPPAPAILAAEPDIVLQTPARPLYSDLPVDLENVLCIIDYCDAEGDETRRRITLRRLSEGQNGFILTAVCHERRAVRHFRLDRIQGVIDSDGVVTPIYTYLAEHLGITLPRPGERKMPAGTGAGDWNATPLARALRDRLRPGLSILVAAALADGHQHIAEIDAIEVWAEKEIIGLMREGKLERAPDIATLAALAPMIAAMRPQATSLAGYLLKICEWSPERFTRLFRALDNVVAADGIIRATETDFVARMNQLTNANFAELREELEQGFRDSDIIIHISLIDGQVTLEERHRSA